MNVNRAIFFCLSGFLFSMPVLGHDNCSNPEDRYLKITAIGDGSFSYFTIVPGIFSANIKKVQIQPNKVVWNVFRYRVDDSQTSTPVTRLDYLGEGIPNTYQHVLVRLTEGKKSLSKNEKEFLSSIPQERYALLFLPAGSRFSNSNEIEKIRKSQKFPTELKDERDRDGFVAFPDTND